MKYIAIPKCAETAIRNKLVRGNNKVESGRLW